MKGSRVLATWRPRCSCLPREPRCDASRASKGGGQQGGGQQGGGQQQMQQQQKRQAERAMSQDRTMDQERLQTRERTHTGPDTDADPAQARRVPGAGIYGGNLMTAQERNQYRAELGALKTDEERQQYQARHREQMQLRAKERGVEPKVTDD